MLRVRHHADGTLWIPRPDVETEARLDARYERWRPGHLRWLTSAPDRPDWTDVLNSLHSGRRCVLVGKGPSLDLWEPDDGQELLAGLNEAVLVIPDPDFAFFVDPRIGEALSGHLPFTTVAVRPPSVDHLPRLECGQVSYAWRWTDGRRDYGVPSPYATAAAALTVLARWGIQEFLLVGFDGFDGDHAEGGRGVYADVLGPVQAVGRENAAYRLINRQIAEVIDWFGLHVAWFHRGESWEALELP